MVDQLVPTVVSPVDVVQAPSVTISEFFGRVANQDERLSACVVEVSAAAATAAAARGQPWPAGPHSAF